MSSSTQLDSHHRVDQNFITDQLPLSLDSVLRDETINTDYCHLIHPARVSNSSETEKNMKSKINFPKSNDKMWTKINEELEIIIPKVFTKSVINKLSTSNLSEKFDLWLYNFFLERFGPEEPHIKGVSKRKARINKDLQHLCQKLSLKLA